MSENGKLTHKQEVFVQQFVSCGNATEAAIAAGYSRNSARQIATENLSKPHIRERVDEFIKKGAEKAEVTLEAHLRELASLRDWAKSKGQAGAAVRAEELRGRTAGLYVDRHLIEDKQSDRELIAKFRSLGTAQGHAVATVPTLALGANQNFARRLLATMHGVAWAIGKSFGGKQTGALDGMRKEIEAAAFPGQKSTGPVFALKQSDREPTEGS